MKKAISVFSITIVTALIFSLGMTQNSFAEEKWFITMELDSTKETVNPFSRFDRISGCAIETETLIRAAGFHGEQVLAHVEVLGIEMNCDGTDGGSNPINVVCPEVGPFVGTIPVVLEKRSVGYSANIFYFESVFPGFTQHNPNFPVGCSSALETGHHTNVVAVPIFTEGTVNFEFTEPGFSTTRGGTATVTINGVLVDENLDTDDDGVIDDNDLCPGTPAGTPVDATGCTLSVDPIIPDSAKVHDSASIGDGTVLGENVKIRKNVVIGNGVTIGDNTTIRKGAQVGDGTTIGSNSIVAKDTVIGNDVTIGDDTKIRKDIQVGNNTIIGSNTTVARNTVIGNDVEIGDGTVIRKNVTIGDGTIIGNDVIIRPGATISPGAEVPDGTKIKKNATFP